MFVESLTDLVKKVKSSGFVVLAVSPDLILPLLRKTYQNQITLLSPDLKTNKISVEAVREFLGSTNSAESTERIFAITQAELLNPQAANALLKTLEEPGLNHHFVFITKTPSALLPTILSRAHVYYLLQKNTLSTPLSVSTKVSKLAKDLIVADQTKLIELANQIAKTKDNPRGLALEVVGAAIEILYKSYFATNQDKYLRRLPNLLKLYDNLFANGHIKLHFVADML